MFGIFMRKKETPAEIAADVAQKIKSEINRLSQNFSSELGDQLSSTEAALEHLEARIAGVEEQMQQSLRHERRRQIALESVLETLRALERKEASPTREALMSLAENLALTRLAARDNPEIDILYSKLTNLMRCFDLALISDIGVPFDPEIHEACGARCEPAFEDGSILEIVRPGFLLRDEVLRCATVIVNRHGRDEENPRPADDWEDAP